MTKLLAPFLLLFVFSVSKVTCRELCQSYTIYGEFFPVQNCSLYCCGSCDNRYCCFDATMRLDQTKCAAESCKDYYDWDGNYHSNTDCNGGFCCGYCNDRYCCWSPSSRLDQNACPTGISTTSTQSYPYQDDYLLYWMLIVSLCFLIAICFVVICRALKRNSRRRQTLNNYARINRNYIINPIIQGSNTNNTGVYEPISGQSYPTQFPIVASNSTYNKNYNTCDLPPSYETVIAKQAKTVETVAENPQ